MEKMKNIYEKVAEISAVLQSVQADSTGKDASGQEYDYLSKNGIFDTVKALERKHRILSIPVNRRCATKGFFERNAFIDSHGVACDRTSYLTECEVTWKFVNLDDPSEVIETTSYATGMGVGSESDKGANRAVSLADKYAFLEFYKITVVDKEKEQSAPLPGSSIPGGFSAEVSSSAEVGARPVSTAGAPMAGAPETRPVPAYAPVSRSSRSDRRRPDRRQTENNAAPAAPYEAAYPQDGNYGGMQPNTSFNDSGAAYGEMPRDRRTTEAEQGEEIRYVPLPAHDVRRTDIGEEEEVNLEGQMSMMNVMGDMPASAPAAPAPASSISDTAGFKIDLKTAASMPVSIPGNKTFTIQEAAPQMLKMLAEDKRFASWRKDNREVAEAINLYRAANEF